jgi:nucleoside-diphosphate-sugar epimerase
MINGLHQISLEEIRGKSIFITGGTGFFGWWILKLIDSLNIEGYAISVTLLSRNPHFFLNNNPHYRNQNWISWIEGDVTSYSFTTQQFDFFIHGAADTRPGANSVASSIFENIVLGTKRVMEHARVSGVERILVISSGAVYGEVPRDINFITEEVNTSPITNETANAYGEAKRGAEILAFCRGKEANIEIVVVRCFAFTGFGIGPHLVLSQLINQAMHDPEIVIKGSGHARRSFLHGQDLSIWLLKLLISGKGGEVYNVGSDEAYSIKEIGELIKNEIAPSKSVIILGSQEKEFRLNYIPSIEKAKSLGLKVWIPLKEAIKLRD